MWGGEDPETRTRARTSPAPGRTPHAGHLLRSLGQSGGREGRELQGAAL